MRRIFSFLLPLILAAQDVSLRSNARVVLAPVSVNDVQGKTVDGLSATDFVVYDDQAAVPVQLEDTTQPLSLVIVVQASESSQSALDKLRKGTSIFGPLITGERGEAAVVAFSDEPRVAQEFTRNPQKIEAALLELDGKGSGGRIIDGLVKAARMLEQKKRDRRRVILFIGEKHDRSSEESLETLISLLERTNTTVYSLTFSPTRSMFANRTPKYCDRKCRDCANTCKNCGNHCDRANPSKVPSNTAVRGGMNLLGLFGDLKRMAQPDVPASLSQLSGGTTAPFLSRQGLETALQRIGVDLHEQYLLSFPMSRNGTGAFHRIRAEVRQRPDLRVRSRAGYFEVGDE